MNALHLVGETVVGTINPLSGTGAAMQRALEEHRACRREIQRLNMENGRLASELEQARALNDDLRGSAEIWIRLYEAQLSRTKRLERRSDVGQAAGGSEASWR
jgi:predicted RNase H-like nuclease (RuvC/YqgF family)